MDCAIATALVKFRLDVNFGDPITPAPQLIDLPALTPGDPPVRVLGYPLETILAEKIITAIALGPVNTRVRDYADIYTLTGTRPLMQVALREALTATARHRGTAVAPLSTVLGNLVALRAGTYAAYHSGLGPDADRLPPDFEALVGAVTSFADGLVDVAQPSTRWDPAARRWDS